MPVTSLAQSEALISRAAADITTEGRESKFPDLDELVARVAEAELAVGQAITMVDDEDEEFATPIRFTLLAVHDPAIPTDDEFEFLLPGHRYIAVELAAENVSADDLGGPFVSFAVVDDLGEAHGDALAKKEPSFDPLCLLDAGERKQGFVLFELNKRARPLRIRLGVDGTDSAADWVMPASRMAPSGAPTEDVLDQLRRLGELKTSGVLTDEEFQAKKKDLLDRL